MKAVSPISKASDILKKNENNRVSKIAKATETDFMTNEMQECFQKLISLVPTIPRTHKISKVQLLQHVIDYILDLEVALDYPNFKQSTPPKLVAAAAVSSLTCRSPLSEKIDPNPIVLHEEFVEMITEAVVDRPVSK